LRLFQNNLPGYIQLILKFANDNVDKLPILVGQSFGRSIYHL
jgi:hypothetical protein